MTWTAILMTVLAGLLGTVGVAGAAVAAHGSAGADLMMLAAAMALVHAPALLALAALPIARPLWKALPGFALSLGTLLFSGDIAMRATTGERLFPMAAPTGGTLLIAGWLLVAVAALVSARRRT